MVAESQQSNYGAGLESAPIMERFQQLPTNIQRLIIGFVFLTVLVGFVMLKEMIKTEEEKRIQESDEA